MLRPVRLARQSVFRAVPTRRKGIRDNIFTATNEGMSCDAVSAPQPTMRITEEFFLSPNFNHCRLCGEVRSCGVSHRGSVAHQLVESIMWLLIARARRHPSGAVGVAPEAARAFFIEETQRWEQVLRHSCCLPLKRRKAAVCGWEENNEFLAAKLLTEIAPENLWRNVVERKASQLRDKLQVLMQLGVLSVVTPRGGKTDTGTFQRDAGFQRMECIGDHNWGHSVCHRLIVLYPEVKWRTLSNVFVVDALRTVLESNQHLDYVFTALQLDDMLGSCESQRKSTKFKADVVEAIAGELHVSLWSLEPYDMDGINTRFSLHGVPITPSLAIFVRSCLNELVDIIFYCYMARYNAPLVRTTVELLRREEYLMDSSSSPFYALRGSRRWRLSTTGSPHWILPPPLPLQREPRPRGGHPNTHVASSWANASVSLTAPDPGSKKEAVPTDGLLRETKRPVKVPAERHITRIAVRELIDNCGALDFLSSTQLKGG
ncbi:RNA editing complex protein [Trypanosoma rangeli]|uniref:RNA editing complex protein n=1 Tax=Trypanosoma rangeli TaxID=5698 RepID=A0A422N1T3_TRYRA|nr:RNA editing complex protein [Trypanosoma rangeli]RNE99403.1 RNA editing complex protein [Trypanosoma rangeli]|eukprot:RNE99403.1 RNA editing complex protein [Trypanosoma rangeli]